METRTKNYLYSVVEFVEEKSLAVVPNNWIIHETNTCSWPSSKSNKKMKEHVLRKSNPDSSWSTHQIKLLYQSRTYEKAVTKLKSFEAASEIESTDSEVAQAHKTKPAKSTAEYVPTCGNCLEISATLQAILSRLNALEEKTNVATQLIRQQMKEVCLPPTSEDIPINSLEDLDNLNVKLENDEEFSKLAKVLSYRGGKDHQDVTRRVLSGLLTTNVAQKLNWRGGENKTSIQNSPKILQLIVVSVRQNKEFKQTSQEEVEDTLKKWLRSSCDRDGGRAKRRKLLPGASLMPAAFLPDACLE